MICEGCDQREKKLSDKGNYYYYCLYQRMPLFCITSCDLVKQKHISDY